MRVCIVIPAYEPGGEFVPYAQEVLAAGLGPVLVVDDGSGPAYAPVFAALAEMGCTVLTHEQNRGKGAALKTALRWYGAHEDGCAGIVTADCDGQHTVKDVRRVCEAMEACPDTLVLGCRDFGPGTPARSATGNRVTSAAMRVLYNIDLKDTQTGLRGIPNGMHRDLLEVRGERYEYELNMLIYAKQRSIPYTIVPIETVYFNNNEGSHYRTVADSARIIHQLGSGLVQYAMSAGLSVVVDAGPSAGAAPVFCGGHRAHALQRGELYLQPPSALCAEQEDRPDGGKILLSVAGAAEAVLCGRVGGVHRAAHGRHAGQAAGGRASGRGQLPGAASLGVQ